MNESYTFDRVGYLNLINRLKATGCDIVPLRDIDPTNSGKPQIGLRHDVDDDFNASVEMSCLEWDYGIKSTYFILNTAAYFKYCLVGIQIIVRAGCEIGWHNNAIADHIRIGKTLHECVAAPLYTLELNKFMITGTASHGDPLCNKMGFINHDIWKQSPRDTQWKRFDLADFGLKYEAYWLNYTHYISDSGGKWNCDVDQRIADFEKNGKQMQVLVHPQHWKL